MRLYKINRTWLYTCAKRYGIRTCRIAGRTYYDKRDIDEYFGTAVDYSDIDEWLTAEEVRQRCHVTESSFRTSVYRQKSVQAGSVGRQELLYNGGSLQYSRSYLCQSSSCRPPPWHHHRACRCEEPASQERRCASLGRTEGARLGQTECRINPRKSKGPENEHKEKMICE